MLKYLRVFLLFAAFGAHAASFVQFSSQQGDPMGVGASGTLTDGIGTFTAPASASNYASLRFAGAGTSWVLDFAVPPGQVLAPGTYITTYDPSFATSIGQPGMLVTIDGHSCSQPTGRFIVYEVQYDSQNALVKLAMDFEQHCPMAPGPLDGAGLYGGVRFNSAVPYAATGVATHTQRLDMSAVSGGYGWTLAPFRTRVLDNSQNPVANATVTFTSGICGTFNGQQSINVSSDAAGIATSPPMVVGNFSATCLIGSRVPNGSIDGFQDFGVYMFNPATVQLAWTPFTVRVPAGQTYSIALGMSSDMPLMPGVHVQFAVQQATGGAAPLGSLAELVTDESNRVTLNLAANDLPGSYRIVASVGPAPIQASALVTQDASPATPPGYTPPPPSRQDMWWVPSESGWGMSLIQHNDTLFGALYIYDHTGKPIWVVMPGGSWDSTHTIYSGSVYKPIGTPFYAYNAQAESVGSPVGNISITFQDANNAVLDYTIAGVTGRKLITRQVFASGTSTTGNHSDLWWGGASQNGWGLTLLQQADTLFGVWFTYDANNDPFWYVMPGGAWTSTNTYEGTLYRTNGSAWVESPYDATKLQVMNAGTFKFQFNGDSATFTYSADGHTGSIPLVREPF